MFQLSDDDATPQRADRTANGFAPNDADDDDAFSFGLDSSPTAMDLDGDECAALDETVTNGAALRRIVSCLDQTVRVRQQREPHETHADDQAMPESPSPSASGRGCRSESASAAGSLSAGRAVSPLPDLFADAIRSTCDDQEGAAIAHGCDADDDARPRSSADGTAGAALGGALIDETMTTSSSLTTRTTSIVAAAVRRMHTASALQRLTSADLRTRHDEAQGVDGVDPESTTTTTGCTTRATPRSHAEQVMDLANQWFAETGGFAPVSPAFSFSSPRHGGFGEFATSGAAVSFAAREFEDALTDDSATVASPLLGRGRCAGVDASPQHQSAIATTAVDAAAVASTAAVAAPAALRAAASVTRDDLDIDAILADADGDGSSGNPSRSASSSPTMVARRGATTADMVAAWDAQAAVQLQRTETALREQLADCQASEQSSLIECARFGARLLARVASAASDAACAARQLQRDGDSSLFKARLDMAKCFARQTLGAAATTSSCAMPAAASVDDSATSRPSTAVAAILPVTVAADATPSIAALDKTHFVAAPPSTARTPTMSAHQRGWRI